MNELEIRRRPVQARSAKTFDHILDTAIVVLEETGWDGFSTKIGSLQEGFQKHIKAGKDLAKTSRASRAWQALVMLL